MSTLVTMSLSMYKKATVQRPYIWLPHERGLGLMLYTSSDC